MDDQTDEDEKIESMADDIEVSNFDVYFSITWWSYTNIFAIGHQRDEYKPTWCFEKDGKKS